MKKSVTKQKFSKIPCSKSKTNKINFELSFKAKNRFSKLKYDSVNKETIEGSFVDTLFFNPDSLNNSKTTFGKNNSFGNMNINNNKLIMFTSSLKYEPKNYFQNLSKDKSSKAPFELSEENYSKNDSHNILIQDDEIDLDNHFLNDDTDRIDYRYYPKIPEIESTKDNNKFYWLATYDRLMKKSKIIKILNYYTDINNQESNDKKLYDEKYNFKEKSLVIKGYEIYYLENFNKPFIRPNKDGKIFIKLYLFNIEQINKIYSYINRLEYKFYINDLDKIHEKDLYQNIINQNKSKYNYSTIICLGSFMNINIYLFSHFEKNQNNFQNNINILPSSNKLAKLIKVLMINFPEYSKNDFINYLTNFISKDNTTKDSLNEKKREVSALLTSATKASLKFNLKCKNSTNSVIKNIIKKIPTYTISSHKTPDEFNSLSENNNNISDVNNSRKTNNYINGFDIFNNIKENIGIGIKKQISEKIINKIDSNSFCLKKKRNFNNIKSNSINDKKDRKNRAINLKNIKNENKNINKTINNISISLDQTQLKNPLTLTRNNTKKNYINIDQYNTKKNKKSLINKNRILISNKFIFPKDINDKENNMNILNTYLINKEKKNLYKYNNNNSCINVIKTEMNKQTRNKITANFNPFYHTNTINTNNNVNIGKKQKRVLSSIRKIIAQKINNISASNNSIFKNMNINNTNNSLQSNIIHGNMFINNKLTSISNNNSKNKISEYITPRKKRSYYYYH